MRWYNNLKIGSKLLMSFIFIAMIAGTIGYVGMTSLMDADDSDSILFQQNAIPLSYLIDLSTRFHKIMEMAPELLITESLAEKTALKNKIQEEKVKLDETGDTFYNMLNNDSSRQVYTDYIETRKSLDKNLDIFVSLCLSDKRNEAIQIWSNELKQGIEVVQNKIQKVNNITITRAKDRSEMNTSQAAFASKLMLMLMIGGMLMAIGMGVFISREIKTPIIKLVGIANRLSLGDTDVTIDIKTENEIGNLMESFSKMINTTKEQAKVAERIAEGDLGVSVDVKSDKDLLGKSLFIMVENLQKIAQSAEKISNGDLGVEIRVRSDKDLLGKSLSKMVQNLKNVIKDIQETSSVLNSASSTILSGSTQLAASSSETATAITETTSTVEEVKQTALQSSRKAIEVSESASKVVDYSAIGKKSTDETIAAIDKIGSQMESIAESVIKLSEQSRAIGEIISSVNDIAEQSNLLAVNASIEAARAGDQGKGFTVVAHEIKNLAEQSKEATTQVKSILNDIQNAINKAVMATEQGSKIVNEGIKKSEETGQVIEELASGISYAADLATQISVSNQQQEIGMNQVALAMENIKLASGQNAATTKDLEASARNLNETGKKLREIIEIYRYG